MKVSSSKHPPWKPARQGYFPHVSLRRCLAWWLHQRKQIHGWMNRHRTWPRNLKIHCHSKWGPTCPFVQAFLDSRKNVDFWATGGKKGEDSLGHLKKEKKKEDNKFKAPLLCCYTRSHFTMHVDKRQHSFPLPIPVLHCQVNCCHCIPHKRSLSSGAK